MTEVAGWEKSWLSRVVAGGTHNKATLLQHRASDGHGDGGGGWGRVEVVRGGLARLAAAGLRSTGVPRS